MVSVLRQEDRFVKSVPDESDIFKKRMGGAILLIR
jgi:hypothetical protein